MTRKITIAGKDAVLRQKAKEVRPEEFGTDELRRLASDMAETMSKNDGVGIAAPQVGESIRVFVVETPDGPAALANPTVIPKTEKMDGDVEGCLSCPGEAVRVRRFRKIEVRAMTIDGEPLNFRAEGFLARVIQHENDHLDGILIIDKK
ncbi:peptide deformylase [Candidatus Uhrbacteria bacterium]|nr:peptide deformylase [Candidatus Uhrbacteria bacterium]